MESLPVSAPILSPVSARAYRTRSGYRTSRLFGFRGGLSILQPCFDGFTGEVLGSDISLRHDASFVLTAIQRARQKEETLPGWFHSDQGSEFDSETVAGWLIKNGTRISISPKSRPRRNGAQESFFGRFKVEFGDFERFDTLEVRLPPIFDH